MKKHFLFTLPCALFSTATRVLLLLTALVALMANTTKTFAENSNTRYKTPDNVDELVGIDPSDACVAGSYGSAEPTDPNKRLCLYNVGTKRFLSVGGTWGTHAALNNTPHVIWLETAEGYTDRFWVNNHIAGSSTGTHLGCANKNDYAQLYMDRSDNDNNIDISGATTFSFIKAPGYSDTNKVYYFVMNRLYTDGKWYQFYVTAYPPTQKDQECNIYNYWPMAVTDSNYKNQVWKVITKDEYYKLTLANPANMEDVIDFSFIMKAPSFRIHNTEASSWTATAETDKIFFGDNKQYKTYANRGNGNWGGTYNHDHQMNYGKLFYSYARGAKNFEFYQDIQVHKAGWYLLRCNGFTTQVNKAGKVSARLMMAVVKDGKIDETKLYSAATLNKLSPDDAKKLMQNDASGTGAGRAFFNGKYENQVQVCLDEKDLEAMGIDKIDKDHPVTLRIGYYVDNDCVLKDGDVTCVDNFKLLYAGPRRNPELILDEDQPSLVYLTNAKDVYKNSVLHLNRTFTEGQWNSLILPVDLKFGQMKRTFGDDVKVAKLTSLKDGVVTFTTVEPKQDSDVMVKAFEPYIIKPTSLTEDLGLPYTAEKFYTRFMDGSTTETNNGYWLAADGKSVSQDENNRFSLTIPAGHYDITMVTLNRDSLIKHLNFSEEDKTNYDNGDYDKINWDNVSWISQTSFSTGANKGDLTCYGTLTKTYDIVDGKGVILPGRDNLRGDYVMRGGKIVHVPSNQVYGLKGFRCWFEVKGKIEGMASAPRLEIDGIIDDATSIDDLNSQPSQFTSRHKGISGVFNLDGQKVRDGESTQDLPKGIYIVNGRKVVVR